MGEGGDGGERLIDPTLPAPRLRLPQNGRATGSVWSERARQPRFVWESEPVLSFEVEVDDSCELGKLQSCQFTSPEWTAEGLTRSEATPQMRLPVSEVAPVGRRYYWRVRACASTACSLWSKVRYLDVGRQQSDFDGDGFSDVVVTDQGSSARQGRVLIGFGPLPSRRTAVLKDAVTADTADHFGEVGRALGDVDADGFADLLVTAPGDQQELPGIAYVYFGSETFADASNRQRMPLYADVAEGRLAGIAVPAGDVDADGQQDFVIDSYPSGPLLFRSVDRGVNATAISVIQSGRYLERGSAGDVTGDGYSDLLLVSGSSNGASGRTNHLLPGSKEGFSVTASLSEVPEYPRAGSTITGDVNGDGFSDLGNAVNYPADASASRIDVTLGAQMPRLDERTITWGGGITGNYADLGGAIAAGDVNGDGFEDSLVGIAWHTSDLVQANLYLGGVGSRTAPDATYAFQTGLALFISQGLPGAPGDVNGDGFDDILLADDYSYTADIFFGGADLDSSSDDHLVFPPP